MSVYHQPWRLVPNRIRGKGGREIDKLRGVSPAIDDDTGSEAWIGSVTGVKTPPEGFPHYGKSQVDLPDGRRMFLFEAIALSPEEVLGPKHMATNGESLGVLVKYLDAQTQYGLQCHPTRPFAKKMWDSDYGKEESWYVIGTREDTEEPAYILLGFKEGVTREVWESHYYKDDLAGLENLCHKIPVSVGESYFVGGGVPHALGAGCFVIEVQEPSDITLGARPFDAIAKRWNLPESDRELYDERLLGAYLYDGCSYEENLRRWRIPRKVLRSGEWGSESILIGTEQTPYFSFSELDVHGEAPVMNTGAPSIAIVLKGAGKIKCTQGAMDFKQGDELFIPYACENLTLEGDATVVLCHPEGVELR